MLRWIDCRCPLPRTPVSDEANGYQPKVFHLIAMYDMRQAEEVEVVSFV